MTHLSPEARALFKQARATYEPDGQRKARVRAAAIASSAMLMATAPLAAATAGASKLGGIVGLGATKSVLLVGFGLLALSGSVALVLRSASDPAARQPTSPAPPREVLPAGAAPAASPPGLPSATTAPSDVMREPSAVLPRPSPVPSARSAREPHADTLAEEVGVLRDARRALQSGRPGPALSLVADYESRYPHGVLREEVLAIRALSLCNLGRTAEATVAAQQLQKLSPHSVQLARIKMSCVAELESDR